MHSIIHFGSFEPAVSLAVSQHLGINERMAVNVIGWFAFCLGHKDNTQFAQTNQEHLVPFYGGVFKYSIEPRTKKQRIISPVQYEFYSHHNQEPKIFRQTPNNVFQLDASPAFLDLPSFRQGQIHPELNLAQFQRCVCTEAPDKMLPEVPPYCSFSNRRTFA